MRFVKPILDKNGLLRGAVRALKFRYRMLQARRGRARGKSLFIGVTGSSGKSTTTALLSHILAARSRVDMQLLYGTIMPLIGTLIRQRGAADFVVIEIGASGIGSIAPMAKLLRPDVAIVTMVRLEHFAAFRTLERVAEEKGALVEAVEPGGLAILNADDEHAMGMSKRTRERVVTFGQSPGADFNIIDPRAAYPDGLTLTVRWRGGELALRSELPAAHFWVPVAAAVTAALELGVPPQTIVERVASFRPVKSRGETLAVPGGPRFLLDTAKAPWHSLNLAFDMVGQASARRKRIVLGNISDYAGSTRKYGAAYRSAREVSDEVIFVGDNSHRSRAPQEDRDAGRAISSVSVKPVSDHIRQTAVEDELILLKGSQNLHLERIALAWTHDVKCWADTCGRKIDCRACGLFEFPFEEHEDIRQRNREQRKSGSFFWRLLQSLKRR